MFEHYEQLTQAVTDGFVSKQRHSTYPLNIYNYTARAQYSRTWNEAILAARGLILTDTGGVVQRPFRKFFNIEEHEELPAESFEVYEKLDGSLGILYWIDTLPMLATRGSFTSEQSQRGTQILYKKYRHTFDALKRDRTYLFEILYPENRIVVDYGGREDVVLLAVIDNETGRDLPLEDVGIPVVQRYAGHADVHALKELFRDNAEGFVVKFDSGLRVKVKFAEYVRLHRIITQVSSKVIWEYLSENRPLTELLDKVPDEFYSWVRQTASDLTDKFAEIERECKSCYKELETRKDTALYFKTQKHQQVLFSMLDKRDYAPIIWKMLKPEYSRPFKNEV